MKADQVRILIANTTPHAMPENHKINQNVLMDPSPRM